MVTQGPDQVLALRARLCASGSLAVGVAVLALSPAGGPVAALLDAALLGLAWWVVRRPAEDAVPESSMSGNQALLLLLAVGGATVLVATGASSRPLHGLAIAPFAMAAFALSSHNPRDLRTAVLAAGASLSALSVADDRPAVMVACAAGLVPLVLAWIAARELVQLQPTQTRLTAVSSGAPPWGAGVVVRLALLTAVAALLLPPEPAPHQRGGGSGSSVAGSRGTSMAAGFGDLDLSNRGSLDARPMLAVPADSPTLWQGGWYDGYDGRVWTHAFISATRPRATPIPPALSLPSGPGLTTSVETPLSALPMVYAPGPLVAVGGDAGTVYDLGHGSMALLGDAREVGHFSVTWATPGSVSATLAAAPAPVDDPHWVALPAELPQRVRDLASQVTTGATTTGAKVAALESYLRTHEKYSLSSPVPALGVDAVDAFLFTDHVGFCEQFASAETVMLRSLGIPARLASGYGGGGAQGADGQRVYRNQDAHAWVQVGYPDGRWVDSDPTAGSQQAAAAARSLRGRLAKLWHTLTATSAARRWTALGLLAAALVGWWAHGRLRSRRSARRPGTVQAPRPSAAGRAYDRLLVRLAEQDRPRRPNETLRDLLLRLRAPDADTVARLLETEWYGDGRQPVPDEVAEVVAILDGLAVEPLVGVAP